MGLFRFNMTRGPKKHLKRVNAPRHWMLDKLTGAFAPKPSAGPHKSRDCLPMLLLLRNRLKYALTYREVKLIVIQRLIKVDHQVRTDHLYPCQDHRLRQARGRQRRVHQRWSQHWACWCDHVDREAPGFVQHYPR